MNRFLLVNLRNFPETFICGHICRSNYGPQPLSAKMISACPYLQTIARRSPTLNRSRDAKRRIGLLANKSGYTPDAES